MLRGRSRALLVVEGPRPLSKVVMLVEGVGKRWCPQTEAGRKKEEQR